MNGSYARKIATADEARGEVRRIEADLARFRKIEELYNLRFPVDIARLTRRLQELQVYFRSQRAADAS